MKLLFQITLIIISSYFLISYTYSKNPSSEKYYTRTGKIIMITETHPVGKSLSTIEVTSEGFEDNIKETMANIDPITDIFITDLDGNGFDEIYIITTSVGSGSYGNLIGFASNKDKSLSMINLPDVDRQDPDFRGYMGHDIFSIENKKLIRYFPVYLKDDTNQKPTGGTKKLMYGLYPGKAMWQLKIEREND